MSSLVSNSPSGVLDELSSAAAGWSIEGCGSLDCAVGVLHWVVLLGLLVLLLWAMLMDRSIDRTKKASASRGYMKEDEAVKRGDGKREGIVLKPFTRVKGWMKQANSKVEKTSWKHTRAGATLKQANLTEKVIKAKRQPLWKQTFSNSDQQLVSLLNTPLRFYGEELDCWIFTNPTSQKEICSDLHVRAFLHPPHAPTSETLNLKTRAHPLRRKTALIKTPEWDHTLLWFLGFIKWQWWCVL